MINQDTMNKKICFLVTALLLIWTVSGCRGVLNAPVGTRKNITENQEKENIEYAEFIYEITDTDRLESYVSAELIDVSILDDTLIINKDGDYLLSGKNNNCNIVIDVYEDEIVHLFFSSLDLAAQTGPVIYVQSAAKVVITSVDGTENMIADSSEYATENESCIFSNSDLTINGSGKLTVYGYYHDAIRSKDTLKVIGTDLYIRAKNDGLRGNDGVVMESSNMEIESEGVGVLTDSEQGYVVLQGGSCKITSGENAIAADSYVAIHNCRQDLYSVLETVKCNGIKEIDEGN